MNPSLPSLLLWPPDGGRKPWVSRITRDGDTIRARFTATHRQTTRDRI